MAKKLGKFIVQAGVPQDPGKRVDLALGAGGHRRLSQLVG